MARIAGINIPSHQHTVIGLTAIFGIGRSTAKKICAVTSIPESKKVKDLDDADLEYSHKLSHSQGSEACWYRTEEIIR